MNFSLSSCLSITTLKSFLAIGAAVGPYKNPRYAMSVFIEHGGSGGSTAAPMAKKLFKVVIDRHEEREKFKQKNINFVA